MAHEKEKPPPKAPATSARPPNPVREMRSRLSYMCAGIVLIWVLLYAVRGDQSIYSPGPVSTAHAVFESDCKACHAGAGGVISRAVTDAACSTCHAGPIHHDNQVFKGQTAAQPQCAACHIEHRGETMQVTFVPDSRCSICHEALQVDASVPVPGASRPPNGFITQIRTFTSNHPEFRLIAEKTADPTPLKLNHVKHLQKDLLGGDGRRVQLQCGDCHRMEQGEILPVQFERDCQSCHSLAFDERIPEEAPHELPVFVVAFARTAFSKYAGSNPGQWKQDPNWHPARTMIALRNMLDDAPESLPAWVEQRVATSKRVLFNRCRECHDVDDVTAPVPKVVPVTLPDRWLVHSRFSHKPHRVVDCVSCHAGAPSSKNTADLLLPGRSACLTCHNDSSETLTNCSTCHRYHQPFEGHVRSPLKLENLRKR